MKILHVAPIYKESLQATTREPHWSAPEIPHITLYLFIVLPAMASTPSYFMYYQKFTES